MESTCTCTNQDQSRACYAMLCAAGVSLAGAKHAARCASSTSQRAKVVSSHVVLSGPGGETNEEWMGYASRFMSNELPRGQYYMSPCI